MRYGIDKSKKPAKLSIHLASPSMNRIGSLNNSYNKQLLIRFNEQINELSFTVPYYVMKNHKKVKNKMFDLVKSPFLVELKYGETTEWFLIRKVTKSANDHDTKNVLCYSLGYELNYRQIRNYEEVSINCIQALTAATHDTNWKIGYVNPDFNLKYKKFDISLSTRLQFVYEIAEAFDGVAVFDSINRLVHMYKEDEVSRYKGFWIKYGKYIQTIEQTEDIDEIVTRLNVRGSDDLVISTVNPTGETYIDDFSYYLYPFEMDESGNVIKSSESGMSDDLCKALVIYNLKVSSNETGIYGLLQQKKTKQQELTTKTNELTVFKTDLKVILDSIEAKKADSEDYSDLNQQLTAKQNQISAQEATITTINDAIALIDRNLAELKSTLKLENNLTVKQMEELRGFIHEGDWTDENHIDENDLYDSAIKEMKKINSPPVHITMDIVNFFEVVEEQRNWNQLQIGDIVKIKHDKLGIFVEAKIVEIGFDFESSTIKVTVSNTKKVKSLEDQLKEVFYTVKKVNTDYNQRKQDWIKTTVNYNLRNDRIKEAPTSPIVEENSITHTQNDNGSVDLTFSWKYPDSKVTNKNEDNIDGFLLYLYSSTNSERYVFGSQVAKEAKVDIRSDVRSYTFPSITSNLHYTVGIRAYRRVDEDISLEGIILSDIIATPNPYLPNPAINMNGRLNGINFSKGEEPPSTPALNDIWIEESTARQFHWNGEKWKDVIDAIESGEVSIPTSVLNGNILLGSSNNSNGVLQAKDNNNNTHTEISVSGIVTNKISITRPDGFTLVNNSIANFDFSVHGHEPPFMDNGVIKENMFYLGNNVEWGNCNLYNYRHNGRYLKLDLTVKVSAGGIGRVRIVDRLGNELWSLSHEYTESENVPVTIDLGIPDGSRKSFFLQLATNDIDYYAYVGIAGKWQEG